LLPGDDATGQKQNIEMVGRNIIWFEVEIHPLFIWSCDWNFRFSVLMLLKKRFADLIKIVKLDSIGFCDETYETFIAKRELICSCL
jgi:hypothetical protein